MFPEKWLRGLEGLGTGKCKRVCRSQWRLSLPRDRPLRRQRKQTLSTRQHLAEAEALGTGDKTPTLVPQRYLPAFRTAMCLVSVGIPSQMSALF